MSLPEGLHYDVPAAEYHADPCEEPSLSAHVAMELIDRSPLHARQMHPRLGGGGGREATPAMDRGTLIHALLLGKDADRIIEIVGFDNYKTKAAQEARDAARAAGYVPMLSRELAEYRRAADILRPKVTRYIGQTEVTAVWRNGGATCRARFDSLHKQMIVDLKSCEDARRASNPSTIVRSGLHIQAAAYLDAGAHLDCADGFAFVFVEVVPPYGVIVAALSPALLDLGRKQWRRAVETWRDCLATDYWPGYDAGVVTIDCPQWALFEDERTTNV